MKTYLKAPHNDIKNMASVRMKGVGRVATKNASLSDIKVKQKLGLGHHYRHFPASDNKIERNSQIREENSFPLSLNGPFSKIQ
jgi:hypothetical protein